MGTFFKSTWFRCVAVLLVIAAVAGGLLAILNDVLYVSAEEKTSRAIKKIYGETMEYSVELDVDSNDASLNQPIIYENIGEINKVYVIGDKTSASYDRLFKTTGYKGYKNGTITLWIKVTYTENQPAIKKVILEDNTKQTLMSKLTGSFYDGFLVDKTAEFEQGKLFTANDKDTENVKNPVTGATYSATAACNSVNCVLKYVWGN